MNRNDLDNNHLRNPAFAPNQEHVTQNLLHCIFAGGVIGGGVAYVNDTNLTLGIKKGMVAGVLLGMMKTLNDELERMREGAINRGGRGAGNRGGQGAGNEGGWARNDGG
jgi:hypothetical protein